MNLNKRFEHTELLAKLLDYFFRSNESNINQHQSINQNGSQEPKKPKGRLGWRLMVGGSDSWCWFPWPTPEGVRNRPPNKQNNFFGYCSETGSNNKAQMPSPFPHMGSGGSHLSSALWLNHVSESRPSLFARGSLTLPGSDVLRIWIGGPQSWSHN